MALSTLMLIRHAEKPVAGGPGGVDEAGVPSGSSLTPRGWQRVGALARLFCPRPGTPPVAGLAVPGAVLASAPGLGSTSRRPLETVAPLAALLRLEPDLRHGKGGEQGLAEAVQAASGTALVSWQHERIPAIVACFAVVEGGVPTSWPGDRFDLVWVLDRTEGGWAFSQVAQLLLDRDDASLAF